MLEKLHIWLSGTTERRVLFLAALIMLLPALRPSGCASVEDVTLTTATKLSSKFAKKPNIVIASINEDEDKINRAIDKLGLLNTKLIIIDERTNKAHVKPSFGIRPLKGGTKIIRGYEFYPTLSDLPADYAKAGGKRALYEAHSLALPTAPTRDYHLKSMSGIELDAVKGGTKRSASDGFSNIFPDEDGVVRRMPLAVRMRHRAYPSLALASASAIKGFTPLIKENASGKPSGLTIGEDLIDVSSDTSTAIGFKGKRGFFPHVNLIDIVEDRIDVDDIAEKIVIIGYTDPELAPMYETPLGKMPAVEILASSLQNILSDEHIRPLIGIKWAALTLLIVLVLYSLIVVRFDLTKRIIITAIAIALVWAVTLPLFIYTNILLPAAHFSIYASILLIISIAWRLFVVEVPRRFRMRTFQMRISPEMLEKALRKPGTIVSQGITRSITAIAIDIRGYGALATSVPSEKLCPFLREYRTILSRLLIKYGAFVDSWTGDECRAAFGAFLPQKEPEILACRAALHLLRIFSKARDEIAKRYGIERLSIGIGISSGPASVGSLGPRGVTDINITGQAMELARTLRALGRNYRTAIIADDATRQETGNYFSFRPLDPILYGGRDQLTQIHELLGRTGVILPQVEKYLEAREAYLRGDFETAVHLFGLILAEYPHDGPSQLLLKRARVLASSPPKGDWKGAWQS